MVPTLIKSKINSIMFKANISSVAQSCPTLCGPMDCIPPSSSVHGILQARILEWVAISSSGELPNPEIKPGSPELAGFTTEPPGKPSKMDYGVRKKKKVLSLKIKQMSALQEEGLCLPSNILVPSFLIISGLHEYLIKLLSTDRNRSR